MELFGPRVYGCTLGLLFEIAVVTSSSLRKVPVLRLFHARALRDYRAKKTGQWDRSHCPEIVVREGLLALLAGDQSPAYCFDRHKAETQEDERGTTFRTLSCVARGEREGATGLVRREYPSANRRIVGPATDKERA